jgi:sodium/potassium/calcium exchanger 6
VEVDGHALSVGWLVVLFRMVGSTAEDFFSPSFEMMSLTLGLPPRFAGVTLLALGNGAPDIASTVNAILGDSTPTILNARLH